MRADMVVAWTYEASEHCEGCAFERFNVALYRPASQKPPVDSEGNPPQPVFADQLDDFGRDLVCGTCGEVIYEQEDGDAA